MSRFTEDLVVAAPGAPPKSLSGLMTRLGLWGRSDAEKRAAIARWLRSNEPTTRVMRDQLVDRGYLPAETDRAA
ncbi:MAG: hypothetical protein M0P31_13280 [Solirubrobacteraceae bacterium]|nr:hypothetical protein [Solirubrobacteraceae bacterium]